MTNSSDGPVNVWVQSLGWYSLDPIQLLNPTSSDVDTTTDPTDATTGDQVYTLDEDGNRVHYNGETDEESPLAGSEGRQSAPVSSRTLKN